MTYLYCLLRRTQEADASRLNVVGIGDAPVRRLAAGTVEAWVSTLGAVPESSLASIRAHDAVVGAALATGQTPIPARFGQVWPSDELCVAALRERGPALQTMLRQLAGLVEMSVCTLLPGMPPARPQTDATSRPGTPGTAYLRQLRASADRERHLRVALDALRARVTSALGAIARGEHAEVRGGEDALALSVAYLIQREDESRFRDTVQRVARESAARLVVAGPRAPYSFAPTEQPVGSDDDRAARPDWTGG